MNISLTTSYIETPIGKVLAIADESSLHMLEFADKDGLQEQIEKFQIANKAVVSEGRTNPIISIESELNSYFEGNLKEFKTPLHFFGSPFQQQVWQALMTIPYGETRSYSAQAAAVGKPKAFRAAANANARNRMAIVIPCHRVINNNGKLGGYAGGIARKQWLLDHEGRYAS